MTGPPALPARRLWRRALLLAAILVAALVVCPLVLRILLPGPDRRATADALDQASRIARAGYVLASTYSGDQTPSNAVVADEIATGTGVHAVLARSVPNPDRHGVGTMATVDVVLIGETGVPFGVVHKLPVCVRFAVVREETGPRDVHYEQRRCPSDIAAVG
jgi:hypothetical protein